LCWRERRRRRQVRHRRHRPTGATDGGDSSAYARARWHPAEAKRGARRGARRSARGARALKCRKRQRGRRLRHLLAPSNAHDVAPILGVIECVHGGRGVRALDEDTVERAIELLERLPQHARMVGVVSHVPELRKRIPARLEVLRGDQGSYTRCSLRHRGVDR
jgi:hypothetical protein